MLAQIDLPNVVSPAPPSASEQRGVRGWRRWLWVGWLAASAVGALLLATRAYWEEVDALQTAAFMVTTRSQNFAGKNEALQVGLEYDARVRGADSMEVPASAIGRVAQYEFSAPVRGLRRLTLGATNTSVELVRITNLAGVTLARLDREKFHPMPEATQFRGATMIVMQSPADPKNAQDWTGINPLPMPAGPSKAECVGGWAFLYMACFTGMGWLVAWLFRVSGSSKKRLPSRVSASLSSN